MDNYALELIRKGRRVDGREFDQFRKVEVRNNIISKAEGSSRVRIGGTEVIAGVKLNLGTPFPDMPDNGNLSVNAEFSPIASPDFEPGPPSEDATELARVVYRGIRESHSIELKKLCITPGEKVWSVFVDLLLISHKGNLLDACSLAAVNAIWNARVPKIEDEKVIRGEYSGKLPVVWKPVNISVCKVDNHFLMDPALEEEDIIDAKLCIAIRDDDKICSLQKQGRNSLKFNDLEKMFDLALEKSRKMREHIISE